MAWQCKNPQQETNQNVRENDIFKTSQDNGLRITYQTNITMAIFLDITVRYNSTLDISKNGNIQTIPKT